MRADIQGLRAVAVALVVAYHLWPDTVRGGYIGVDVFFVISGYLITSHLLHTPPRSLGDLLHFWERRARRLLPAGLTVLATTLVVVRLLLPVTEWERTAKEAGLAALDVVNWQLVRSSVDYLAADDSATAVQHFWSLSVEEQLYAVWPIVILVATAVLRRRRWVAAGMGAIAAVSLAHSWSLTARSPDAAYFATTTRLWELVAGGLLAVGALTVAPRLRTAAAWTGVVVIVGTAGTYSDATAFPGIAALLPVCATVLAIAARADAPRSPAVVWSLRPVRWMGDVSYSFYLWHWPVLVVARHLAPDAAGLVIAALTLAVTAALADVSYRFVERRFMDRGPRPVRTAGWAVVGIIAVVGISLWVVRDVRDIRSREELRVATAIFSDDTCIGAGSAVDPSCEPSPLSDGALLVARFATSEISDCLVPAPYRSIHPCTFGDGDVQVAVVGNSHAAQWLPALNTLAGERNWTITTYLAEVCNTTTASLELADEAATSGCRAHTDAVLDELTSGRFDLVVHAEVQIVRVTGRDWPSTGTAAKDGYVDVHRTLLDAGVRSVVIADPVPPATAIGPLPACLARDGVDGCTWSADAPTDDQQYTWSDPLSDAVDELADPRLQRVTLDDVLCPERICRPVIGGVVTFSDASHVSAIFARTTATILGDRIDTALAAMPPG